MKIKTFVAGTMVLALMAAVTPVMAQSPNPYASQQRWQQKGNAGQPTVNRVQRNTTISNTVVNRTYNTNYNGNYPYPYNNGGCWNCGGGDPYNSGVAIAGINAGANVLMTLILGSMNNSRGAVYPGIQR